MWTKIKKNIGNINIMKINFKFTSFFFPKHWMAAFESEIIQVINNFDSTLNKNEMFLIISTGFTLELKLQCRCFVCLLHIKQLFNDFFGVSAILTLSCDNNNNNYHIFIAPFSKNKMFKGALQWNYIHLQWLQKQKK
jgi:hypothetical protein